MFDRTKVKANHAFASSFLVLFHGRWIGGEPGSPDRRFPFLVDPASGRSGCGYAGPLIHSLAHVTSSAVLPSPLIRQESAATTSEFLKTTGKHAQPCMCTSGDPEDTISPRSQSTTLHELCFAVKRVFGRLSRRVTMRLGLRIPTRLSLYYRFFSNASYNSIVPPIDYLFL